MKQFFISIGCIAFVFGIFLIGNISANREPYIINMYEIKTYEAIFTAYTADIEETDDDPFISASGQEVREGMIACPRYIPLFSIVKVFGKTYTCLDRMNVRYKDRFDIFMQKKEEAFAFGKRVAQAQIIIKR